MGEDQSFIDRLSACLGRVIPDFESLLSADRLTGGASFETYRISLTTAAGPQDLALRRIADPATRLASDYPDLPLQAALMEQAKAAGVPEPSILYVLEENDGLGAGYFMEWLEGEALGHRIVRSSRFEAIRPKLAFLFGEALAKIHRIDLAKTGLADQLVHRPTEGLIRAELERYESYECPMPMIDYTGRWLLDHLPEPVEPALVHADFRNGNVMISKTGLVAVLDWEISYRGDPARDLGWICCNSWRFGRSDLPVGGFGTYEDLFAGYESVSGTPIDRERVRFWEVFGSFWWAVGCLTMTALHRAGQDASIERISIGRRSSECQMDCINLLIPGPVDLVGDLSHSEGEDMPSAGELIGAVANFLTEEAAGALPPRTAYLSKVAANSLAIAERDLRLGPGARAEELSRLRALLGRDDGSLIELRAQLSRALQVGDMDLARADLQTHLRQTVANQLAIDQPKYSALKDALQTL